ncbi:hypothetical protein [Enterococcus sp. LJL90]
MKKLNKFVKFDIDEFLENIELIVMKSDILVDFETKKVLGAKYSIIVWSDTHNYGGDTNGVNNVGETFTVKVLGKKPMAIPSPCKVDLINPNGNVYGEFRNNLSVTAEDVTLLEA